MFNIYQQIVNNATERDENEKKIIEIINEILRDKGYDNLTNLSSYINKVRHHQIKKQIQIKKEIINIITGELKTNLDSNDINNIIKKKNKKFNTTIY